MKDGWMDETRGDAAEAAVCTGRRGAEKQESNTHRVVNHGIDRNNLKPPRGPRPVGQGEDDGGPREKITEGTKPGVLLRRAE